MKLAKSRVQKMENCQNIFSPHDTYHVHLLIMNKKQSKIILDKFDLIEIQQTKYMETPQQFGYLISIKSNQIYFLKLQFLFIFTKLNISIFIRLLMKIIIIKMISFFISQSCSIRFCQTIFCKFKSFIFFQLSIGLFLSHMSTIFTYFIINNYQKMYLLGIATILILIYQNQANICPNNWITMQRNYPDQWVQETDYSLNYLGSNFTIKEKGSDLLSLSTLIFNIGFYDMVPVKLNDYILKKNGTYDKGQLTITYYPGSIINWGGFKDFGLQYVGQFDSMQDFHGSSTYVITSSQYRTLIKFKGVYVKDQKLNPQSQYGVCVVRKQNQTKYLISNPNKPQKKYFNQHEIDKFIVFKEIPNLIPTTVCTSICSEQNFLEVQGVACRTPLNTDLYCKQYLSVNSSYQQCYSCGKNLMVSIVGAYADQGTCHPCQQHCQQCFLDQYQKNLCIQCEPTFILGPGSKCFQKVAYTNCKILNYSQSNMVCSVCELGYYFNGSRCINCQQQCVKCQNQTRCQQCHIPYILVNGMCQQDTSISRIQNCETIMFGDTCEQCSQGYTPSQFMCINCSNNDIYACKTPNVLHCVQYWGNICTKCQQGYDAGFYGCRYNDPYCQNFDMDFSGSQCSHCKNGYYFNAQRTCIKCIDGLTSQYFPFQCFNCHPPASDPSNMCDLFYLEGQCSCDQNILKFILQIDANIHGNFFQNSTYRQSKLYEAIATYLNIEWHSIKSLSFQFIKTGDQTYYVFVGYVILTVGNFQLDHNLINIRSNLKQAIFDFDSFSIISIYAEIQPFNYKIGQSQLRRQQQQEEQSQQQGLQSMHFGFIIIGFFIGYLLLIFLWNYIKRKIKHCHELKKKIQPQHKHKYKIKKLSIPCEEKTKRNFELEMISMQND